MIAVEYHADLKEVQSIARLSALLAPCGQSAPFDRLEWWQGLASACALEPLIISAHDEGATVMLPLSRGEGQLTGLSNWYTFRLRPLILGEGDPRPLLRALASDLANHAHRITLDLVPDEDGSATLLEAAFREAGWAVSREQSDSNHVLVLRGRSWEEYLAQRPGQLRSTIRRKAKRLDCRIVEHFDADLWAAYEAVYRQSWKPQEGSMDFLRAFALAEGAAGRLRMGIALSGGEPVAAQVWTVEGATAFIHKLAYREQARALSPGSVLSAAMFRHVIERDRVEMIDYGTGDDAYKRDWMEEVRPRYRLRFLRPNVPRNWLALGKLGLQRLAATGKPV